MSVASSYQMGGHEQQAQSQNKCEVCGQIFSSQNDLSKHYKDTHNLEVPPKQTGEQQGQGSKEESMKGGGSSRTWKEATQQEAQSMQGTKQMPKPSSEENPESA